MPKNSKKNLLLLAVIAAVLILYAHWETYWMQIIPTTVSSDSLPAEFSGKKIVFVSDVHCGEGFGIERLDELVQKINSLKPDIVLMGGDYASRDGKNTDACFNKITGIEAPLGKFGVLGNHDIEAGKDRVQKAMRDAGITPLVNENNKIAINESEITIAGTDETWYGKPDGAKAMANATSFAVYLSHDPAYLEKYRPAAQLLLSGHTHGGQITLFGIPFAGLIHGQNYKYEKGVFNEPGRTIIVT
ncbi:MAG: metallophosphoesterase, partial [Candidatus Paceibacterota bacterium]